MNQVVSKLEYGSSSRKVNQNTTKPYPINCGRLHRSNYVIMFYHKPYFEERLIRIHEQNSMETIILVFANTKLQ